jgi:threonine synthase
VTAVFRCHGCGVTVDRAGPAPFRWPGARPRDDVDHVLAPVDAAEAESKGEPLSWPSGNELDPYLRYRTLLSPYRLARAAGLSDGAWAELLGGLDARLAEVDGHGFRATPLAAQPALARAAGHAGQLWVKDETGNVSGSHKARHLVLVELYLRVVEAARLPAAAALSGRRLAIASCGNAALAAAVVAAAARRPLDVFIPPDASAAVVERLRALGAAVTVCERRPGEAGDPCFLRFQEAVAGGAVPFGVQGTENGLAVEGGRTLAFELADGLREAGVAPDVLHVQVGGGALASALAQGLALAAAAGVIPRAPRLVTVQTTGCAPLARAFTRLGADTLADAARRRSRYMWPWETTPVSLAHGILDDETYDWWAVAAGMRATGGQPVIASEAQLFLAQALAAEAGLPASATGTAGLAGLLAAPAPGERAVVILSGADR